MSRLERGLCEVLVTQALEARLAELDGTLAPDVHELRSAEAADRIALHVGTVLSRALEGLSDKERVEVGTALARQVVQQIDAAIFGSEFDLDAPVEPAAVLRSLARTLPTGAPEAIPEPLIPLFDTTLLTNSPGEPRVASQRPPVA